MRTAVISDLHLGLTSGGDVLRDPGVRSVLLEEIGDADRVVLLGDAVELRELPLGQAMERARPFFEELGAALGDRPVTLVPGNHDHRFAEPLLDDLSLRGEPLGLERTHPPTPGPTATIDAWLGPAPLQIAYPGLWLRDDLYATHGHYMDAHLTLPRAECVAVAAAARISGPVPDPAGPAEYERLVRPLYGLGFGVAQVRRGAGKRNQARASEAAWETLAGAADGGRRRRLAASAAQAAFPAAIWGVNRLLRSRFEADVSGQAIFHGGLAAATEMSRRLGLGGVDVITGHSHRAGPLAEEGSWPLPGGGRLHNTGSWVFASAFHLPGRPPNPYWPGTVTWVEDSEPPRRAQLLHEHSHDALSELLERAAD